MSFKHHSNEKHFTNIRENALKKETVEGAKSNFKMSRGRSI